MSFSYFYNTVFGGETPQIPPQISDFIGNKLQDWNGPNLDNLRSLIKPKIPPTPPLRIHGSYKYSNRVLEGDIERLGFHPGRTLFRLNISSNDRIRKQNLFHASSVIASQFGLCCPKTNQA
ncbi:hypothetical protein O3M35_005287 [Rhynocoris fuscipes]|uniref:Uncharacterized protein n=1 Tax=Rhynocoris fuscipes TaxID=488301 RepID=A0AAW1DNM1_9HEMI